MHLAHRDSRLTVSSRSSGFYIMVADEAWRIAVVAHSRPSMLDASDTLVKNLTGFLIRHPDRQGMTFGDAPEHFLVLVATGSVPALSLRCHVDTDQRNAAIGPRMTCEQFPVACRLSGLPLARRRHADQRSMSKLGEELPWFGACRKIVYHRRCRSISSAMR